MGSRVKYLVDTPELIWGCLDGRQHLEAARRYLRAELVHDLLLASFPPAVLHKFPLLRHHWPTVTKFKCVREVQGTHGAGGGGRVGQALPRGPRCIAGHVCNAQVCYMHTHMHSPSRIASSRAPSPPTRGLAAPEGLGDIMHMHCCCCCRCRCAGGKWCRPSRRLWLRSVTCSWTCQRT